MLEKQDDRMTIQTAFTKHHFNDWKGYAADAVLEIDYDLQKTWNICFHEINNVIHQLEKSQEEKKSNKSQDYGDIVYLRRFSMLPLT